jgi:dTMP kinase
MNAKFISLEGIEGVGKSTIAHCIHSWLDKHHIVHQMTREPGGTEIAEAIRYLLLAEYEEQMTSDTELLLMFAARAQHLASVIKPTLAKGQWVVSDRFTDASYAYQGGGREIDFARIEMLERYVHPDLQPDLTILLTAPVELAMERARNRNHSVDRFEKEALYFFQRAQEAYLIRAKAEPHRFQIVDTSESLEHVEEKIQAILATLLH